jgi:hypothetical protein
MVLFVTLITPSPKEQITHSTKKKWIYKAYHRAFFILFGKHMIMYDFIWFSWQSQILKNICKSNSSCVCIFCTLLHRHVSPSSPHKVLDYFVWSRLTNTYIYLPGLFEQDTKQNNLREKKHEKSARPDRSQGRLLVLLGVWLGRHFICFLSFWWFVELAMAAMQLGLVYLLNGRMLQHSSGRLFLELASADSASASARLTHSTRISPQLPRDIFLCIFLVQCSKGKRRRTKIMIMVGTSALCISWCWLVSSHSSQGWKKPWQILSGQDLPSTRTCGFAQKSPVIRHMQKLR